MASDHAAPVKRIKILEKQKNSFRKTKTVSENSFILAKVVNDLEDKRLYEESC